MGSRRKNPTGYSPKGNIPTDMTPADNHLSGDSIGPDRSPRPDKPPRKPKPSQTDQTPKKNQTSGTGRKSGSGLPALTFPAECRLKNRKDIQAVFDQRDMAKGRRLAFYRKARTEAKSSPSQGDEISGSDLRLLRHPSQRLGHPRNDNVLPSGQKGSEADAAGKGSSGESLQPGRFCLVVSKKCGIAVRRNRIKRILREILRQNLFRIQPGYDYIVVVFPSGLPEKINQEDFIGDFATYFGWK